MHNLIFTFTFLVLVLFTVQSQVKTTDKLIINSSEILNTKSNLPELNVFIESALKNSPLLQISDKEIDKILEEIKIHKKSWTEYIQIDGNARYGLLNQLTVDNGASSDLSTVNIRSSDNQQLNYYGGISLKIPISYFANKRNQLKILNSTIQESELKKEQLKNEITSRVIEDYYKLKSYNELLETLENTLQTMKISYQKSIKEVENGILSFTDFSRISASYSQAEETFSKVRNEYYAQYYKLQILTGINIQSITK